VPFRRVVGAIDTEQWFQDGCVRIPKWFRGEHNNSSQFALELASRACAKIGSSTSSADVLGGFELVVILHDAIVVETMPPVGI
jgi:hypothetical protein